MNRLIERVILLIASSILFTGAFFIMNQNDLPLLSAVGVFICILTGSFIVTAATEQ